MASINQTRSRSPARSTTSRRPTLPPQGGLVSSNRHRTHEGAPAAYLSDELQLRRSVSSCLLWEDEFYEDGRTIASRIVTLVGRLDHATVTRLAVDARSHLNLRHVPLLMLAALAAPGRGGTSMTGDAIADVIQRPDEITEFLTIYARLYGIGTDRLKGHLAAQVKRGLARAFVKFDGYQLAKYFSVSGEAKAAIRGRDVMRLVRPKALTAGQSATWRRLLDGKPIQEGGADTWETALSSGANKRETFTRLLEENRLGYVALLRNLRNMEEAGVDHRLVDRAILAQRGAHRVFPFRYVAAARACPAFVEVLDRALAAAVSELPALVGRTCVLVDVSGSMNVRLSARSDLTRMDAAATLATLIPGHHDVFSFSNRVEPVLDCLPGIRGVERIVGSQPNQGTDLGAAVRLANRGAYDRLIVVTDEQSQTPVPAPTAGRAYMINVASNQNGVGYGHAWVHLDGFSEQVIRWIWEFEKL